MTETKSELAKGGPARGTTVVHERSSSTRGPASEFPPASRNMLTDETALVNDAREGDSGAFLRLVWLYDRQIFRLARYLTESDADAEFVLLETFFQASERLSQIEGGGNFRKLIIQIAVHEASLIYTQTETRKGALLNEVIDFAERSSADAPYPWEENLREQFSSGEMEKIRESAIRKLDPLARQAFVLREIEGLSIEDASRIVGLPVPAFKESLLRARLRLPEHLACQMKSNLVPRGSDEHLTSAVRGAPPGENWRCERNGKSE